MNNLGIRSPVENELVGKMVRRIQRMIFGGNIYNRAELAGAFGDLGTFIPFVVAYIMINGLDPSGILVAFGIMKIFVGLYFKTPISVQPMKAIGGMAIAHPEMITHGMIWGSGLFTAIFWLTMALTGTINWLARIMARPIMYGIMLGLGLSFIMDGVGMMGNQPIIAVIALGLTFLFLSNERLPALLLVLGFGLAVSFIQNPTMLADLHRLSPHLRLPEQTLTKITWHDLVMGTLILGLPQVPLTLGNAILGIVAENNALFPGRPVEARTICLDHGLMNIVSASIGGVPLCHGAGGMAGHVRFGARTGGALVILGIIILTLGLFFSDSVTLLFWMIPKAILGVILFFTGLELASIIKDIGDRKEDIYVLLVTAGVATINMGVAFLAGLTLYYALQRGIIKV
ncbi:MAG: putative sulfate/molybdate transporter [Chloroflexi bacterium]|nr:putative sulfate/molybdate transporter [Chloroflexota bacterium]